MKVPVSLSTAFGPEFQETLARFACNIGLLERPEELASSRFINRSIVPHVIRLSALFNRQTDLNGQNAPSPHKNTQNKTQQNLDGQKNLHGQKAPQSMPLKAALDPAQELEAHHRAGLSPYWGAGSNPAHLRLAYFLYFMPANMYRVAAIWAELARLGYRWPHASSPLRAIEPGAGPASGACGVATGERHAPIGLPSQGNWALVERDTAMLSLGAQWAQHWFSATGQPGWGTRSFARAIDFSRPLLPRSAPRFHLWVMSYFLNESSASASALARLLIETWKHHLEEEGLVILVEPALRLQSRRLLELRQALLAEKNTGAAPWLQILLPCLGHQNCGALADPEDWCHEEVSWWRPPYYRLIDHLAGLDRKTLPFSYLVIARSSQPREALLPALAACPEHQRYRLVSPSHWEGADLEFFVCGQDGKHRMRYRPLPPHQEQAEQELSRGAILLGANGFKEKFSIA